MVIKILTIVLISFFAFATGVMVWSSFQLKKVGLLKCFIRHKWLTGLLSLLLVIVFCVNGIALLSDADWAVLAMRYTIYFWLAYSWLYGLGNMGGMVIMLNKNKAKSIAQLAGQSELYTEVLQKTFSFSEQQKLDANQDLEEGHVISDENWEDIVENEEWFEDAFPQAMKKRIKKKLAGLIIQSIFLLVYLLLLNGDK